MPLSCSITDFSPLLLGWESIFTSLQDTGIDGVELVVGIKSRWNVRSLRKLAKKYHLPILSLHQPIWSGLDFYFDEGFFTVAQQLETSYITVHPLPNCEITSEKMMRYFEKLARVQEKYNLTILIENLSHEYSTKYVGKLFPLANSVGDLEQLYKAAKTYNLGLTFDTSHLQDTKPQENKSFRTIAPLIQNIHLSSFNSKQAHLPVYMGDFDTPEFMRYLSHIQYQGLLTFEIYYPKEVTLFHYSADSIKKSVSYLKEHKHHIL
ncbi:sugar phosphate isomerase/epimerase [soil metagenome]